MTGDISLHELCHHLFTQLHSGHRGQLCAQVFASVSDEAGLIPTVHTRVQQP